MISKQKISLIRSLRLKKYIYETKLFVIEGEKLLIEVLNSQPELITEVFVLKEFFTKWEPKLQHSNAIVNVINARELGQVSNLSTPSGILVLCKIFEDKLDIEQLETSISLYLHEIRDPGNMGTLIRTADWFGIKNILCSPGCVDVYNAKVVQATMGSIFRINISNIELAVLIDLKTTIPLIATVMNGSNLYEQNKFTMGIIMLGSESHGLPDYIINIADHKLSVPKAKNSNAESLNVAVAAGIICSHLI